MALEKPGASTGRSRYANPIALPTPTKGKKMSKLTEEQSKVEKPKHADTQVADNLKAINENLKLIALYFEHKLEKEKGRRA